MQQENNRSAVKPWHLASMTGLGRHSFAHKDFHIDFTCKSVNHRTLDSKIRIPKELQFLERDFYQLVGQIFNRGRIEVEINLTLVETLKGFENAKAQSLFASINEFKKAFPALPLTISLKDVVEVLSVEDVSFLSNATNDIMSAFKAALLDLLQSRSHEGSLLTKDLQNMIVYCYNSVAFIKQLSDADVTQRAEKFKARVDELFHDYKVDPARLYQECALLAERSDFQEEIDRLDAHVQHFYTLCESRESKGRKLDFLCQEMLREINTLLSKALNHEIIKKAIDIKAEIERIREQVQNIE